MRRALVWLVSFFCSAAFAADLDSLIERDWQMLLARDPIYASSSGLSDRDHLLPDASFAALQQQRVEDEALLRDIDAVDKESLSGQQAINHALLRWRVAGRIMSFDSAEYALPFNTFSSFFNYPVQAMADTALRTEADIVAIQQRVMALPAFFGQHIDNMRRGIEMGKTMPRVVVEKVLKTMQAQVYPNVEDNPLWNKLRDYPAKLSAAQTAALDASLRVALEEGFNRAFRELVAFVESEYLPASRASVGAYAMQDGEEYYRAQIHQYVTTDKYTAEDIHAIGLSEVKRIRAEMEVVKQQANFDGDLDAFIAFLRSDQQFYATTPRALLSEASFVAKRIDYVLPKFFATLPRLPYGVQPVPDEIAPAYSTAAYWPAPLNSDRGGAYMVNTYRLDQRPLYELPALTLHEAVPGHHHQMAISMELENVPAFRKQLYFSSYGEGWALYTEKLGVEMGIYQNAYEDFGRLSYEMWRAARLVIDTGLHAKGWSRQQAIDFLASNTSLSMENVVSEVDRYISWPGQALSYKLGELLIWELRREAEQALGDDFDVRQFHDAVLRNGALPMALLAEQVRGYIADAKVNRL
ncbi:MAG: hypothetical protein RL336_1115 [Pseudomonadota bacterium]